LESVRVALAALITATVSVVACGCATSTTEGHAGRVSVGAPTAANRPDRVHLTSRGQLLKQFEGLLRSRFGSKVVCERAKPGPAVFVANGCTPLADYDPYFYTFSHPVNTTLRLSHRRPMDFGNYPRVIRIGRNSVRCNSGKHPKYLITYSDASSFSLSCQAPQ
jgi:hypothetical protein